VIEIVKIQPGHGCHQQILPPGCPGSSKTFPEQGCVHVHKGERDKLGEATGLVLDCAEDGEVTNPVFDSLAMTVHDGCRGRDSEQVRLPDDPDPFISRNLTRADHLPHIVYKDLCGRPAERTEACSFHLLEDLGGADPALSCGVSNLHRIAGMDMNPGSTLPERGDDTGIRFGVKIRVESAHGTYFRDIPLTGKCRFVPDLVP